jgi:hypothetical protein
MLGGGGGRRSPGNRQAIGAPGDRKQTMVLSDEGGQRLRSGRLVPRKRYSGESLEGDPLREDHPLRPQMGGNVCGLAESMGSASDAVFSPASRCPPQAGEGLTSSVQLFPDEVNISKYICMLRHPFLLRYRSTNSKPSGFALRYLRANGGSFQIIAYTSK